MWVKDAPKEEGYYWVKVIAVMSSKVFKTVVHVYSSNPDKDEPNTVFWDGENYSIKSGSFKEWWSEKIKEPEWE